VLTLVKPEVTLFLLGFLLTQFVHNATVFGVVIHLPYFFFIMELLYLPTYFGNPRFSGHRRLWSIRGGYIYQELAAYWFANIIRESPLNPNSRHIFGYHPHGLFPMGAVYVSNTTQWMRLFPDVAPCTFCFSSVPLSGINFFLQEILLSYFHLRMVPW
jgi:hypothetical protein